MNAKKNNFGFSLFSCYFWEFLAHVMTNRCTPIHSSTPTPPLLHFSTLLPTPLLSTHTQLHSTSLTPRLSSTLRSLAQVDSAASASASSKRGGGAVVNRSIAWRFQNQLTSLMTMLKQTDSHFIRCIKSNDGEASYSHSFVVITALVCLLCLLCFH